MDIVGITAPETNLPLLLGGVRSPQEMLKINNQIKLALARGESIDAIATALGVTRDHVKKLAHERSQQQDYLQKRLGNKK